MNSSSSTPCTKRTKIALLILLLFCFGFQSLFVYSDTTKTDPFSEQALDGRRIWQQNNCQACHQLYGFGGFLGPDLTNVTARIDKERIHQVLTMGSGQMPAFHLNQIEIDSMTAFLTAMNETGQGQASAPLDSSGTLHALQSELKSHGNLKVTTGFNRFVSSGCLGCHFSPTQSSIGAADLLEVCERLDRNQIMQVLKEGKMPKMPKPFLTNDQKDEIYIFLTWLSENKSAIKKKTESQSIQWSQVPWWEFDR